MKYYWNFEESWRFSISPNVFVLIKNSAPVMQHGCLCFFLLRFNYRAYLKMVSAPISPSIFEYWIFTMRCYYDISTVYTIIEHLSRTSRSEVKLKVFSCNIFEWHPFPKKKLTRFLVYFNSSFILVHFGSPLRDENSCYSYEFHRAEIFWSF